MMDYFGILESVEGLKLPREDLESKLWLILVSFSSNTVVATCCVPHPSGPLGDRCAQFLEQAVHSWLELGWAKWTLPFK